MKSRDIATTANARRDLLQYFRQEPNRVYRVGHIANWLRGGFSLERTEELFLALVEEGILLIVNSQELGYHSEVVQSFILNPEALSKLPSEDRSYGTR